MSKKKLLSLLLAGCLTISTLAGCSSARDNTADDNAEPAASQTAEDKEYDFTDITVTYVKSPLNVPSIVEKEQQYFAEFFGEFELGVSYSDLTTGPEQTQALASGDIQFLYAVGATSVILSASNGADIKVLSTYSRSPEAFRLFTADESITSAEDLRGKKVAGPKGTILHELLIAYLATANMTEADIEFYALDIPSSQAALVSGEVDCALLAGPTAYNMEKDGYRIVTTGEGLVDATIVTATSQAFYDANPELVAAFLVAQEKTIAFMDENYEEAMQMTATETELDIEAVKEMYPMYDFDPTIRDSDIEAMKKTAQFMLDNEMIETEVDVDALILSIS